MKQDSNWGILIFIISVISILLIMWLAVSEMFRDIILLLVPYLALLFSLLSIIFSYLSYPRVHNMKLLFTGFILALIVCSFYVGGTDLLIGNNYNIYFVNILYALLFIVLISGMLMPTFVSFRTGNRITISIVALLLAVISLIRILNIEIIFLTKFRVYSGFSPVYFIPAILTIIIITVSVVFLRNRFQLGGLFSSMLLVTVFGWYFGGIHLAYEFIDSVIFFILPLIFTLGITIHWLSRINRMALYDPLLRVYNKGYCMQILMEQSLIDTNPPLCIAIIDLDHFKKVNDKYGHAAGDEVLIKIADTITRHIIPNGTVCRYGGEEFIVFMPETDKKICRIKMEELREAIKKTVIEYDSNKIRISVSIGLSVKERKNESLMDVFKIADRALYTAKKAGRNRTVLRT